MAGTVQKTKDQVLRTVQALNKDEVELGEPGRSNLILLSYTIMPEVSWKQFDTTQRVLEEVNTHFDRSADILVDGQAPPRYCAGTAEVKASAVKMREPIYVLNVTGAGLIKVHGYSSRPRQAPTREWHEEDTMSLSRWKSLTDFYSFVDTIT